MAFFQESQGGRRPPAFNAPGVVLVLAGALIAAYVEIQWSPRAQDLAAELVLWPKTFAAGGTLFSRLVTPFSHLLVETSLTGLTLNCLCLLAFGTAIARRFGSIPFFAYFLLCGIAGGAAFVVHHWNEDAWIGGASAAIAGLTGGALRIMDIRRPYLNVAALPLQPLLSRQILAISAVWVGINLLIAFAQGAFSPVSGTIVWEGYVFGFLAGLLLAGPFDHFFGLAAKLRRRDA